MLDAMTADPANGAIFVDDDVQLRPGSIAILIRDIASAPDDITGWTVRRRPESEHPLFHAIFAGEAEHVAVKQPMSLSSSLLYLPPSALRRPIRFSGALDSFGGEDTVYTCQQRLAGARLRRIDNPGLAEEAYPDSRMSTEALALRLVNNISIYRTAIGLRRADDTLVRVDGSVAVAKFYRGAFRALLRLRNGHAQVVLLRLLGRTLGFWGGVLCNPPTGMVIARVKSAANASK
jgi:hypothetical protein